MKKFERREFIDLGIKALVFIPLAGYVSCNTGKTRQLSPEESLKKLIMISGPWPVEDKALAEDFARRFLNADHLVSQYLPKSGSEIQELAANFPDDLFSVDEIEINNLPSKKKELLISLINNMYDINEIQFYLAGVPQWGACIGDNEWHTKIPD